MPNKSGIEALDAIKKQDPNAKMIVVSSLHEQKEIDETKKIGIKAFIQKPIIEEDLIKAIKDNL